jgi:predicted nucleic acid-binding protein
VRTALDTNVLSALWSGEIVASEVAAKLREARDRGGLTICAPVYAELLAHPSATQNFVDTFLSETNIIVDFDLTEEVWRLAARGFASYANRRRHSSGDSPKRLLVDFMIGAHASLRADRLMSLDKSRYDRDFPQLHIY